MPKTPVLCTMDLVYYIPENTFISPMCYAKGQTYSHTQAFSHSFGDTTFDLGWKLG